MIPHGQRLADDPRSRIRMIGVVGGAERGLGASPEDDPGPRLDTAREVPLHPEVIARVAAARKLDERKGRLRSVSGEEETDPYGRQAVGVTAEEGVIPLDRLENVDGVADELVQAVLVGEPALVLKVQAIAVGVLGEEGPEARDAPVFLCEDRGSVPDVGKREFAEFGGGADGACARIGAIGAIDDGKGLRHPGAREDPGAEPAILGRRLPGHVAALVGDWPDQRIGDETTAFIVAEIGIMESELDVLAQRHAAGAAHELEVLRDQDEGSPAALEARVAQILGGRSLLQALEGSLVAYPEGLRRLGHVRSSMDGRVACQRPGFSGLGHEQDCRSTRCVASRGFRPPIRCPVKMAHCMAERNPEARMCT